MLIDTVASRRKDTRYLKKERFLNTIIMDARILMSTDGKSIYILDLSGSINTCGNKKTFGNSRSTESTF